MLQATASDDRAIRDLRRRKLAPRPARPAPVNGTTQVSDSATIGAELLGLIAGLWRSRWLIALATGLGLLAGIAFLLMQTPIYQSVAQILIDPREKRIIDGAVVPQGFGSSAVGADTLLVDSQVEIISSRSVLERAVTEQKLLDDPEYFKPRSGGMRASLRNWFGAFVPGYEPEQPVKAAPIDVVIDQLRESYLWINRSGNTYIVDVAILSKDAAKSTRVANAVAEAYLADLNKISSDTTHDTTRSLEARIDEQREKVRLAESAVETYKAQAGLIGSPGLLVDEQQLRELNARLVITRTQSAAARARYEQLKSVAADSIDVGATAVALLSPVISNLRTQHGAVAQRESQLAKTLGRKHPDLINVRAELAGIEQQIGAELSRIKASARNEMKLAEANQNALEGALDTLKSRADENNQAQVKLRELEREAQAARAVFESYLIRAKQTSAQEKLESSSTRILSLATVPLRPVFPKPPVVLIASLLAGLMTGLAIAWGRIVLAGFRRQANAGVA